MSAHSNSRSIYSVSAVCLAGLIFAANLAAAPAKKPSPTPTPLPTRAPSATPTAAPSATPTAAPSATPAPTTTPAPTATTAYCPLPLDYGLSASSATTGSSTNTQSPEKEKNLKAVCHHPTPDQSSTYIILCVPPSAYSAHIQHGDVALPNYTCTKSGNNGPCNQ